MCMNPLLSHYFMKNNKLPTEHIIRYGKEFWRCWTNNCATIIAQLLQNIVKGCGIGGYVQREVVSIGSDKMEVEEGCDNV